MLPSKVTWIGLLKLKICLMLYTGQLGRKKVMHQLQGFCLAYSYMEKVFVY